MNAQTIVAILLGLWICLANGSSLAHPLGNFSISHYSGIHVGKNSIAVRYIIDMAEIPTFQEIQEAGIPPTSQDPSVQSYLTRKVESLRDGLTLELNGQRLPFQVESTEIIFPPGAGGLPTMKVGVVYRARLNGISNGGHYSINYRDGNFPGRAGWKEIIAAAEPGIRLVNSSVAEKDRSAQLSDYPADLLNNPPQDLAARIDYAIAPSAVPVAAVDRATAVSTSVLPLTAPVKIAMEKAKVVRSSTETPAARPSQEANAESIAAVEVNSSSLHTADSLQLKANSQSSPRNSFTEIMAGKELGSGIIFIALTIAVGLGAFHALEPGHGKTLVAAYLVGSRGTFKHAFLLGLIVTASHTAGVYLLGAVTLYASKYVVPDRLYPWLGVLSGVMITVLGLVLLVRRYRGKEGLSGHPHDHGYDHGHDGHSYHHQARRSLFHHDHDHYQHDHGHHHHGFSVQTSLRELLTLGISGGIVPCPAALVVLLSAVSMDRTTFGLLLIVAFSAGLASVLIAIGLLMVYARQFMVRFQGNGQLITCWLPLTSSVFIALFGVALTWQALQTAGLLLVNT
jgi:ABC-type nickel/cobalt efflux system permease component RcnA